MTLGEIIKSLPWSEVSLLPLSRVVEASGAFSLVIGCLFRVVPFNLVFVGSFTRFSWTSDRVGGVLLCLFIFFNQQLFIIVKIIDDSLVDDRRLLGISRPDGTPLNDFHARQG